MKGFEYRFNRRAVDVGADRTEKSGDERGAARGRCGGREKRRAVGEQRSARAYEQWREYRNTPAHLVLQAEAENLAIVNNLIVNKEQRIPDIAYAGKQVDRRRRRLRWWCMARNFIRRSGGIWTC